MSGITDIIIPMPMNEIDAMTRMTKAATKFASGTLRSKKNEDADAYRSTARIEPVEDREDPLPGQVHRRATAAP